MAGASGLLLDLILCGPAWARREWEVATINSQAEIIRGNTGSRPVSYNCGDCWVIYQPQQILPSLLHQTHSLGIHELPE